MLNSTESSKYQDLINSCRAYRNARDRFFESFPDKSALFNALLKGGWPEIAFELLREASQGLLFDVLPGLVHLAGSSPKYVVNARNLIFNLPREHLLLKIEPLLIEQLDESDANVGKKNPFVEDPDWLYRRFLELSAILDVGLLERIIDKAKQNSNPEVQEAGRDFEEELVNGVFKNPKNQDWYLGR